MSILIEYTPWLSAMVALIFCSGFFSSSEAALFYLSRQDRKKLALGSRAGRIAAGLLDDPDRLLTAVLFWNLVVNIVFFAIASILSLELRREGHPAEAGGLALGSLLALIFFSELFPKSVGVLRPRLLATLVGMPLAVAVRVLDPVIPMFRLANLLSQRLLWPGFRPEPYLRVRDLERAVELSGGDAQLVEQEQTALRNIVSLSDLRVDELMRPRLQFLSFRPPVSLGDLDGQMTPSGYLLVTEPDSDEVASAIALKDLVTIGEQHLEHYAEDVIYVPWSSNVGATLEAMRRRDRSVAAVVNEFGETIGILTLDDILDTIFTASPSRSERIMHREPIRKIAEDRWQVTGMTSLRRLGRYFQTTLPESRSVTIAGIMQEMLQRVPQQGDRCDWGPFHCQVIESPDRGQLLVELIRITEGESS